MSPSSPSPDWVETTTLVPFAPLVPCSAAARSATSIREGLDAPPVSVGSSSKPVTPPAVRMRRSAVTLMILMFDDIGKPRYCPGVEEIEGGMRASRALALGH
jgi:hypothetical protein